MLAVTATLWAVPLCAQVNATVNTNSTIAVIPEYFMGAHVSVYDNSLQYTGSPVFNQLDGLLDAAGVNVLRYPGGGYADVYHWSIHKDSPFGGTTDTGYVAPATTFPGLLNIMNNIGNGQAVITVNYGSALELEGDQPLYTPALAHLRLEFGDSQLE